MHDVHRCPFVIHVDENISLLEDIIAYVSFFFLEVWKLESLLSSSISKSLVVILFHLIVRHVEVE